MLGYGSPLHGITRKDSFMDYSEGMKRMPRAEVELDFENNGTLNP